jgi:hypothetical protein
MYILTFLTGKKHQIQASRFYPEDTFTIFANANNERVFAVQTSQVFTIELTK